MYDLTTYRDFNLDDYQLDDGSWQVDWWKRGDPDCKGTEKSRRRKSALENAKRAIDAQLDGTTVLRNLPRLADGRLNGVATAGDFNQKR